MPTVKFERGFISYADRLSVTLRTELGLQANEPLCPWRLAEHLNVAIYKLSLLPVDAAVLQVVTSGAKDNSFSAAVCYDGCAAFILHNDGHNIKRQASDIAHELAHILLRHPANNPFDPNGCRDFSAQHEAEAERLGPNLLISDSAAVRAYALISENIESFDTLSDSWGVTKDILNMRINLSGARKRYVKRAA